ncbi:hypothetical protein IY145_00555 [Methylosinus sp. H3A]|uniref:hypothetical protein n=1 Tax=Methylosinus sp. H3A TaxID=2785786 RepID=UPI0018C1F43F|nr:hypothetical protein [Methylosinus sp. H3A]MBG0807923.1 hypothetical protein [Methylosinus sp. H3A]
MNKVALIVAGPPGIGKSEICALLKPLLYSKLGLTPFFYIWGDAFAHISYPWQGEERQLQTKYRAIRAVISTLFFDTGVLLIDDLFASERSLELLASALEGHGFRNVVLVLRAPLATVLSRNMHRYQREVVPNHKVVELYKRTYECIADSACDVIDIDANGSIENTMEAIIEVLEDRGILCNPPA